MWRENIRHHSLITHSFIMFTLPCIVRPVVSPQVGQMIDFGFSENEMIDECLPLTLP